MPSPPGSAKRDRREFAESTDSSQDFSVSHTSDVSSAKKAELLRKAKKKARKIGSGADRQGCDSIKSHFSTASKSVGLCPPTAMATGSSVADVSGSGAGSTVADCPGSQDIFSHADIMRKLCDMCGQLTMLNTTVEELRGEIFDLRQENEKLRTELASCQKRQERMEEEVREAKYLASVAERRVNDLEQYTRRNNIRVIGVPESDKETVEECESKVLRIIKEKLQLPRMDSGDIEAIHRIGRREQQGRDQTTKPRPVIVRFLSRKATEAVLRNRRLLKNSGIVIVEDLTRDNFALLNKCRDHAGVEDAWTRRGTVYVRTVKDSKIQRITKASDLNHIPTISTSTPISQRRRQRQTASLQSVVTPEATSEKCSRDRNDGNACGAPNKGDSQKS